MATDSRQLRHTQGKPPHHHKYDNIMAIEADGSSTQGGESERAWVPLLFSIRNGRPEKRYLRETSAPLFIGQRFLLHTKKA